MANKIAVKLLNLKRAFAKLSSFVLTDKPSELERTGIIKAFEYTFELYWKTFKVKAELEGLTVASPKAALSYALQAGLITNEDAWLDMLEKRNLGTHTYNEEQANEIYKSIKDVFVGEFDMSLKKLEENG
ncbi:MAG: HI0074 family nucleotidyltransferase substrate-binding subunit [Proteobacteria bacterium]|nr:HI0074 family nucleotidyltransferase substrate-binding subunit [Pseudomonadota bacterium]